MSKPRAGPTPAPFPRSQASPITPWLAALPWPVHHSTVCSLLCGLLMTPNSHPQPPRTESTGPGSPFPRRPHWLRCHHGLQLSWEEEHLGHSDLGKRTAFQNKATDLTEGLESLVSRSRVPGGTQTTPGRTRLSKTFSTPSPNLPARFHARPFGNTCRSIQNEASASSPHTLQQQSHAGAL